MNAATLAEAHRLSDAAREAGKAGDAVGCKQLNDLAHLEMLRLISAAALERARARLPRSEQDRAADRQAAGESREAQP